MLCRSIVLCMTQIIDIHSLDIIFPDMDMDMAIQGDGAVADVVTETVEVVEWYDNPDLIEFYSSIGQSFRG